MLVSSLVEKVLLWNTTFLFISCLDNGEVSSVYLIFFTDFQTGLAEDGGKWKWKYWKYWSGYRPCLLVGSALEECRIHLLLRCGSSFSIYCVHSFVGEWLKCILYYLWYTSPALCSICWQEAHSHGCWLCWPQCVK